MQAQFSFGCISVVQSFLPVCVADFSSNFSHCHKPHNFQFDIIRPAPTIKPPKSTEDNSFAQETEQLRTFASGSDESVAVVADAASDCRVAALLTWHAATLVVAQISDARLRYLCMQHHGASAHHMRNIKTRRTVIFSTKWQLKTLKTRVISIFRTFTQLRNFQSIATGHPLSFRLAHPLVNLSLRCLVSCVILFHFLLFYVMI